MTQKKSACLTDIHTAQGYGNLGKESFCQDRERLVKVKHLLMRRRCVPADMKNLVPGLRAGWGVDSEGSESLDFFLDPAALGMRSHNYKDLDILFDLWTLVM